MKRYLIFGATSAIAQETARILAKRGDALFLAARDPKKLEAVKEDLKARGASKVGSLVVDALDFSRHAALLDKAEKELGGLDVVLVAHGTLGDQKKAQDDFAYARKEFEVNFLGAVSLLTEAANRFEARGSGLLAVIGSVAGDRGRQSNYVYGTAKAALTAFLSGLRNRLASKGVAVLTIKPGFVDTPMTAGMKKGLLSASPAKVAKDIVSAMDRGRDVLYTPWFWKWIMLIIRSVPESVFKKTKL